MGKWGYLWPASTGSTDHSISYRHRIRSILSFCTIWYAICRRPIRNGLDTVRHKMYTKPMGWPTSDRSDYDRSFSTTITDQQTPVASSFTHRCLLSFSSGDRWAVISSARKRRRFVNTIVRGRMGGADTSSSSFIIQKYLFFRIYTSLLRIGIEYLTTSTNLLVRRFIRCLRTLIATTGWTSLPMIRAGQVLCSSFVARDVWLQKGWLYVVIKRL